MPYQPPKHKLMRLRSREELEQAMAVRDLSGAELARMAGTSRQLISRLRTGERARIEKPVARAIEKALRVELFSDEQPARIPEAVR